MDYYGREPSSDFFMHYGVKGMKWGVRKAIEKGNAKRLGKEFAKAQKKLDRLNSAANIKTNERRLAKNKKIAAIGASVGLAGTAAAANQILKKNSLIKNLRAAKSKMDETSSWTYAGKRTDALMNDDYDTYNKMHEEWHNNLNDYYDKKYDLEKRAGKIKANHIIGGSLGAAGLGTAAVAGGRAALAKYRTTAKGHAKAVAKRDAFKKAMNEAFNDKNAKQLAKSVQPQIREALDKSANRTARENVKNKEYAVKKSQKQAKRRARLERKIGRI